MCVFARARKKVRSVVIGEKKFLDGPIQEKRERKRAKRKPERKKGCHRYRTIAKNRSKTSKITRRIAVQEREKSGLSRGKKRRLMWGVIPKEGRGSEAMSRTSRWKAWKKVNQLKKRGLQLRRRLPLVRRKGEKHVCDFEKEGFLAFASRQGKGQKNGKTK